MSIYLKNVETKKVVEAHNTGRPRMGGHAGHTWDTFHINIEGAKMDVHLDTTWGRWCYFERNTKWHKCDMHELMTARNVSDPFSRMNADFTLTTRAELLGKPAKQPKQEQVVNGRTLSSVRLLAEEQLATHGLLSQGWRFKWIHSQHTLGRCFYHTKHIALSTHIVLSPNIEDEIIMDTILHEVAHALEPGAGHGPVWVTRAKAIGCSGTRLAQKWVVKPKHWYKCDKCDYILETIRQLSAKTLLRSTHKKCGGRFHTITNAEELASLKAMGEKVIDHRKTIDKREVPQ